MHNIEILSHSAEETISWGAEFIKTIPAGTTIALTGPLGAGKTTLVRGFAEGLNVPNNIRINSPTYILCNIYEGGTLPLFHFDWYRLENESSLLALDMEEYTYGEGICVIEWADKYLSTLPSDALRVDLRIKSEHSRHISLVSA